MFLGFKLTTNNNKKKKHANLQNFVHTIWLYLQNYWYREIHPLSAHLQVLGPT